MKRIITSALVTAGLSSAAFAGSLEEPVVTAPPPPPPPVQLGGDWTGPYIGLQLGYADVDADAPGLAASGDDILYGLHAGYNYDFGQFVLGGEIDYDFTDIDLTTAAGASAAEVDSVARLKAKAGYDAGPALIYLTGGVAQVDTSLGNETGEFYGIGLSYQVSDRYVVGAEILEHSFDDIDGTGVNADATTFTIRGSLRF
ncbi:MAG: outer membrane beta-barrel protein [Pseudomonadota bacterium]